jgi:hypothetical protein
VKLRTFDKDILGGALMFATGIGVTTYSMSFEIGTLGQMGPGFFPVVLGLILTTCGIAIAYKSRASRLNSEGATNAQPPAEWRAWALIIVGIASFIALARITGLIFATFSIVFISALGDRDNSWKSAILLALLMVVVSVIVFWWALQIQLPLFAWGNT